MNIEPLSKKIYDTAVSLKVEIIKLHFESGGWGAGYLDVQLDGMIESPYNKELLQFIKDVERWAWDVYSYNGAGDGTEFGDSITYELNRKIAHRTEWWYERQERKIDDEAFTIEET